MIVLTSFFIASRIIISDSHFELLAGFEFSAHRIVVTTALAVRMIIRGIYDELVMVVLRIQTTGLQSHSFDGL